MLNLVVILGYFVGLLAGSTFPELLKHDYKLSLKYPFNSTALGFNVGGDVSFSDQFIRVSPSIPNKSGYVFSARTIAYDNFMIDVAISVTGRGLIGGNGVGIWITDDIKVTSTSSYYGRNQNFKGFGIILSTSDRTMNRKDPFIFGVQNDGSKKASDFTDYTSKSSTVLGGCFSNYRNTPSRVHLRIMVNSHKLSVFTDSIHYGKGFLPCFEANLSLATVAPRGQHVGITANSLNIADDHDLYSLDVYQIDPPHKSNQQKKVLTDEEKKKIEKIQHIVEEVQKDHDEGDPIGGAITVESIQHIMESQYLIMSKLDKLNSKNWDSSSKSDSSVLDVKALEKKIDSLTAQVNSLNEKVAKLESFITQNANALEESLGTVHYSISQAHGKIDKAHLATSQHIGKAFAEVNSIWSWVKYTVSIVGSAILVYGLLALFRKKEERKFI